MENLEIARIFGEVADLLEIQGANPFRVRAYRTAARTVEALTVPCASLVASDPGALAGLTGIGRDLAGKICQIVNTGELALLKELTNQLPQGLVALMRVPGLGPKRAKQIYDALGIQSLDELERAARDGRLRTLRGFKSTLERNILQGIADLKGSAGRFRLADADAYVTPLRELLRGTPGIEATEVAGSYRRRLETVGDLDLLVTARPAAPVAERFVRHPAVRDVLAQGDTKCSVRLRSGLQVDLRIVPGRSYGAALHYFTGSKPHNIAIRTLGVKRGLKINEYGVFRGARRIGGRTEEEVFEAIGLPWMPPELRENAGEIEAAADGRLPRLIEPRDIRGDLQMHTTYTDGRNSIEEMVEACRARGYAYMAITDHTQAVRVARGLGRDGFRRQAREIERLRRGVSDITILKGAEVDILEDGRLDLDEATLAELDLVVIAVHSAFTLPKAEMTRRIVRAMQHPRVHVLAHPTGRRLARREPYAVDMAEIVKAARDYRVLLEVNAQPERLDLKDTHIRLAKDAGVKLVISTDAHRVDELACIRHGVDQARRGWCEARDVANTSTRDAFAGLLRK